MKFPLAVSLAVAIAAISPSTLAVPVQVSDHMEAKVVGGVLAQLAALPLFGPMWLNAAISGTRNTDRSSTPACFVPNAVESGKDIWGSRQVSIPIQISYVRDMRIGNQTTTVVGLWDDKDNWFDSKVAAIDMDVSQAPAIPEDVDQFTRTFHCDTGDRMNPTERAYLFLKVRDPATEVDVNVLSNRFTILDNRWTAEAASALFTVNCTYVSDTYGESLQVRKETVHYSEDLPTGNATISA